MRYLIFIGYTLVIILISVLAYLNVIPTKEITIPYYDSVGHFVLYGIWSFVFANAFRRSVTHQINLPWGIVIVTILTVIEEYCQSFSPVRTFSLTDLGCSLMGIFTGYLIYRNSRRKRAVN